MTGCMCRGQVMHAAGIEVARLEMTQDFFGQSDSAPWPTCVCGCAGRSGRAGRSCSSVVRRVRCAPAAPNLLRGFDLKRLGLLA